MNRIIIRKKYEKTSKESETGKYTYLREKESQKEREGQRKREKESKRIIHIKIERVGIIEIEAETESDAQKSMYTVNCTLHLWIIRCTVESKSVVHYEQFFYYMIQTN